MTGFYAPGMGGSGKPNRTVDVLYLLAFVAFVFAVVMLVIEAVKWLT